LFLADECLTQLAKIIKSSCLSTLLIKTHNDCILDSIFKNHNNLSLKKKATKKKEKKISYYACPPEMNLREWQIALRKQYAQKNDFEITKIGTEPVWADYLVKNPKHNSQYRVALRSEGVGINFCTCGDFRTNTLGTCKHIEAVLAFVKTKRKFKKHLKEPYNPSHNSIYLQYGREQHIVVRLGSEASPKLKKYVKKYLDANNRFLPSKFNEFPKFFKKVQTLDNQIQIKEDALQFIIDKREAEHRQVLAKKYKKKWKSYFDSFLKIRPYPYQSVGIWRAVECGRCLIADEMGLGKTIQAIAAAAILERELNIKKVLVICPTSLKYQWKSEIEKFTDLSAHVIEGNKLKRRETYAKNQDFFNIISHHLSYYDVEELINLNPDLIILDEAQRIKNWSTKISRSVKRIPSRYAFVLTGTPLENKIEELYSILQFTNPYILPPVFEFLHRHRITDESGKVVGYKNMHEIRSQLETIMVRRKKVDVLKELPERSVQNIFLKPTDMQLDMHKEYAHGLIRIVQRWRKFGFLSEKDRLMMMSLMQKMRMVADSTYLVDQTLEPHDTKPEEIRNFIAEILSVENNKVVIFSEWLNMHHLIIETLNKQNIDYEFLNGSVPSHKRGEMVDRFQTDQHCRVFLSTDAGGTGLNLQAASHLINVDLPWNPAKLEQRIARIHRIGQKKHVQIINLISLDTIEYKMLDRLSFKANMAAGILDDGADKIFMDDKSMQKFMDQIETYIEVDEKESNKGAHASDVLEPTLSQESKSIEEQLVDEVTQDEEDNKLNQGALSGSSSTLISSGMQFLSSLAETLKDEKKTNELVNQLVKKDGNKTFLQIPVESKDIVNNIVNLAKQFLKQI